MKKLSKNLKYKSELFRVDICLVPGRIDIITKRFVRTYAFINIMVLGVCLYELIGQFN